MNKQELIEKIGNLDKLYGEKFYVALDDVLDLAKQLDEPESGHADEAPRYLKNILARLRELPLHNREVWLKVIVSEFKQDFSHAKWREGYEQGKLEGAWVGNQLKDADKIRRELNKVKIPQFVADWIEEARKSCKDVADLFDFDFTNEEVGKWFMQERPFDLVARAWLDGYEVEEEKRYTAVMKTTKQPLYYNVPNKKLFFSMGGLATKFTRKELEEAGFGWVFDCPGIEIEEVE